MSKKVLVTSGAWITTKPRNTDYRDAIDKKSADSLRKYITKLENDGLTNDYKEKCYAYAKSRLNMLIKEEETKELRELEAKRKEEAATQRRNRIKELDNFTIRLNILEWYKQKYKWELRELTIDKQEEQLFSVLKALESIDFVNGQIKPAGMNFRDVKFIFFSNKNAILLDKVLDKAFVYYSKKVKNGLVVVSDCPRKGLTFQIAQAELKRKRALIQREYWDSIMRKLPFSFFKSILAEYYLNYTEEQAKGLFKTNIRGCQN